MKELQKPRLPVALVTGFEPFAGEPVNPSAEIARALHGRVLAGHQVVGGVLPCAFVEAAGEIARLLREHRPVLVIGLGQAGGRPEITPERIAINVDDARLPDNRGLQPVDRRIVPRGPAAYWSTLPIKAIVAALQARGVPAAVSQTAGTYVCNHAFYHLMHLLRRRPRLRGGFIHVPYTLEQAARHPGAPGLPLASMVEAVALAVEVCATVPRDAALPGGATH